MKAMTTKPKVNLEMPAWMIDLDQFGQAIEAASELEERAQKRSHQKAKADDKEVVE
tara:strand:- start:497 stop:664 length:168 start_codon:yes stop_codon:yes gene_type:complete